MIIRNNIDLYEEWIFIEFENKENFIFILLNLILIKLINIYREDMK